MAAQNLPALLAHNTYPGRGILLGITADGGHALIAYFIMGRSANSRNRVFEKTADGIVTCAANPAEIKDPSLIIYPPVRRFKNQLIVTNGDHTQTIYTSLAQGGTFEDALNTRTFEPDPPHYTPRISGLMSIDDGFSYKLSILKSCAGNPAGTQRFFYNYHMPLAGTGHFLHTYKHDASPLPSFAGDPIEVSIPSIAKVKTFAETLWQSLNSENKISLFVQTSSLKNNEEFHVFNRYEKSF